MREEIQDRYIFEGRLCDQFISVGQPYIHASDFQTETLEPARDNGAAGILFSN